jgi:hypothetical protein
MTGPHRKRTNPAQMGSPETCATSTSPNWSCFAYYRLQFYVTRYDLSLTIQWMLEYTFDVGGEFD